MNVPGIQYCPSLLIENFTTYSPLAIRQLFNGKKVSSILPYDSPWSNEEETKKYTDNQKHISISGVQEKYSLIQVNDQLRLTEAGERGTHILKPFPATLKRPREIPANEHLTMQIASQIYKINTAYNAIIFFKNGEPAYITRRFDVKPDGDKRAKEDFATLAGKSLASGKNFKYDASYEEISALIQRHVPAASVEMERFFSLVLFNYLFSNGDAHLKNFALLETDSGDHLLSPAYDLMNTRLHIDDADFALDKGLFSDGWKSESHQQYGQATQEDFMEFGIRIGVLEKRMQRILAFFQAEQPGVKKLINRSFLEKKTQELYLAQYQTRQKSLNVKR